MSNLSFQNPNNKIQGQELKDAFVKIIKEDKENEKLVKGEYWQTDEKKGCAVGCSEHAICTILEQKFTDTRHEYLSKTLNIPESLFHLQDRIFESLEKDKADEFVVDFVEALPIKKNLKNVEYKVKIWVLEKTRQYANEETQQIIDNIIELHKRKMEGVSVDYSAAYSAAYSAYSARSAARSAAYSATRSADSAARSADSAAYSARSAARSAAYSAAYSADSAAYSARSADSAFWQELSEFLIETLKSE